EIWSDILGRDALHASQLHSSLGIDDNFFELGGHSLKATLLISKIHKELGVKIPLVEIFKRQTVRMLSEYLKNAKSTCYTGIEPVEKQEYYRLSSAQKRLYFLQQLDLQSTSYNMPLVLPLGKDIHMDRIESAIRKLIARHESLRTSFIMVGNAPVQKVHDDLEFEMEYFDLATEFTEDTEGTRGLASLPKELAAPNPQLAAGPVKNFIRPFDLSCAPLVRSGMIKLPDNNHIWLVDMHHIIADGTSHTILTEDFISLYRGEELKPLRLQYKDFSQWQNHLFASGEVKAQEDYWLNLFPDAAEIPRLNLWTDHKRPEVFTFAGDRYEFILDREHSREFNALGVKNGGTLFMNMLAALNTLFYKYTGQTDIIIGTGIAGRPHTDLQHIIGMFVNTLAMRNYPEGEKPYETFLKEVINNGIKAFENQDVQFEELVDKLELERDPSRNPLFDIGLVVQNFRKIGEGKDSSSIGENPGQVEVLPLADENLPDVQYRNLTTKVDMTFFIYERGEDLHVSIEYYTGVFCEETVRRLALHLKNVIKAVIQSPFLQPDNMEIISREEKQQILYTFNEAAYPGRQHKTVHQRFEEQVEKTPDRVAVVSENNQVTYRELDRQANRVSRYLYRLKGVNSAPMMGIWLDPGINVTAAIWGVLKSGGAYVPIDPDLPEQRKKQMIKDATIGIVLSEKKYIKDLNRLQRECEGFHRYLCMDSRDIHREEEVEKSDLMNRELWEHVGERSTDEITGGGWISSYTGEPFSRLEMDEYGDNVLKKLEPLLHQDMRVLEIGCASGITMYRVAPRVGLYYGTDLSRVIIDKNKQKVNAQGYTNIKLSSLAAHEIDGLEERNFDL
ncbi:MAG: AMP-binding protein, partial [Candidatus Aminicenantes bacterium]